MQNDNLNEQTATIAIQRGGYNIQVVRYTIFYADTRFETSIKYLI